MHVQLHDSLHDSHSAARAAELTKACVHCGFCLETCPTYRDNRDERDSPRGRIYLIKHLLESGEAGASTRLHLDRCLTCMSCETTCPSGMQYGELLEIGRDLTERAAPRPWHKRSVRWLLRKVLLRPRLLSAALGAARLGAPLLPAKLRATLPRRQRVGSVPATAHARKVLLLEGCVQLAATPGTNASARRVLDKLGIGAISAAGAGCCGALNHHLNAGADALDDMRRNIDAWWPHVEAGVEAIVSSASGCGAQLCDYGRLLAHDPEYAGRARHISGLCRDLAQILLAEDLAPLGIDPGADRIALHVPCTLQHTQQLPDVLPALLAKAGFALCATRDAHLCCGSAGTYSLLQRAVSERLRREKLLALCADAPSTIVSANVGCQLHLQAGTDTPVLHWIELFDPDRQ